jgi:hypothetical protein
LLQEGHFKGVADVRLRINFFDELMGIQQGKIQAAVDEAIPVLLDAVNGHLETLVASGDLTEEQLAAVETARAAFVAAVEQLSNDVAEGSLADQPSIIGGLESAFSSLVGALNSLDKEVAEPAEAPAASEGQVVEEGAQDVPSETDALQAFVEQLQMSFEAALEELREAISSTKLPELSEPSGNGVAFEKFLAMYNELLGIDGDETSPPQPESIDTTT